MIALRLLGFLWALPVSVVGLVVFAFCAPSRPRVRWRGYHGTLAILEVDLGRWLAGYGAVTFGCVQGYRAEATERRRRHEDTHTLQGFILGPLDAVYFLFAAALLVWYLAKTRSWRIAVALAYSDNPLERWAYSWEREP